MPGKTSRAAGFRGQIKALEAEVERLTHECQEANQQARWYSDDTDREIERAEAAEAALAAVREALEALVDMAEELWCLAVNDAGLHSKHEPRANGGYSPEQEEVREAWPYSRIERARAALAATEPEGRNG